LTRKTKWKSVQQQDLVIYRGYYSSSWWQPTTLALMITYEWWAFVFSWINVTLKEKQLTFCFVANLTSSERVNKQSWKFLVEEGSFGQWKMSHPPNHWFYNARSELRMDLVMLSFFLLLLFRINIRMLSELKLTMKVIAFFALFFFVLMWYNSVLAIYSSVDFLEILKDLRKFFGEQL